jgi:hypothetical protein
MIMANRSKKLLNISRKHINPMNQEIKDQWVKALRSGEYSQGQHRLRPTLGTYCCLGVLCDLYQKAYPQTSEWQLAMRGVLFVDAVGCASDSNCPMGVRDWADLTKREQGSLINLNDSGQSFEEIADYIETTL